ncbi:hypothetical protein B0H16DRAFT_1747881 [Mycena metata]|uniref:Uncharacterized protein n=1 Tax=Mycena metata TaxID=1033252 RepID=A0AAD7GRP9_9AGAR|nr:hypothetical protein B0H16DRAFT_1747881 [Mycena metata]
MLTLRLSGVVSSLAVGPILPDVSRGSQPDSRFLSDQLPGPHPAPLDPTITALWRRFMYSNQSMSMLVTSTSNSYRPIRGDSCGMKVFPR